MRSKSGFKGIIIVLMGLVSLKNVVWTSKQLVRE